jgi:flagellar hook-length control protein FliK
MIPLLQQMFVPSAQAGPVMGAPDLATLVSGGFDIDSPEIPTDVAMTGFAAVFVAKGVVNTPELETETSAEPVDISAAAMVDAGGVFALPTLPDQSVQKAATSVAMTGQTTLGLKTATTMNDPSPPAMIEGAWPNIVTHDFDAMKGAAAPQPDLSPDLPKDFSRPDAIQQTPSTGPKAFGVLTDDLPSAPVIAPQIGTFDIAPHDLGIPDLGIPVAPQAVVAQIVQILPISPQPMAVSLAESMFITQIKDQPIRPPVMQAPQAALAQPQMVVPLGKIDVMPIVKTIKPLQDPELGKTAITDRTDDAAVIDYDVPVAPLADIIQTLTQDGGPEGQPLPTKIEAAPPQIAAPVPHLPATAPQLAAQILPHSHAAKTGPIEVLLNPAELGHLRFEIHQKGEHVQVVLTAERPETLDLLRRNGEQLATEFRNAGFSGASLSFGQWGRSSDGQPPASFVANADDDFAPVFVPQVAKPPMAQDNARNLNLRL